MMRGFHLKRPLSVFVAASMMLGTMPAVGAGRTPIPGGDPGGTIPPVAGQAPGAPAPRDPLSNIEHFIIVYQENWSFDSLYGDFPGANGIDNASTASLTQRDRLSGSALADMTGTFNIATRTAPALQAIYPQPLDPTNSNAIDARFPVTFNTLVPYELTDPALNLQASDKTSDIVHRYWQEQFQVSGAATNGVNYGDNSGFATWSDNPGLVMSYFDATYLPEGMLAQHYTMCDNYFHSAFGGSFLNHQFLIAAAPPVYTNMPVSNNGNIGYLDGSGLFAVNASGGSTGKVIRDGNITPMNGDVLSNLTINGVSGQTATVGAGGTPSDVAFHDGSHFDRHYAVNTIFSANLQSHGGNPSAVNLLPSQNNTNPAGADYHRNIGDLLDDAGVSWKWYSGGWNNALDSSPSNPITHGVPNTVDPLFQWHHQAFAFFEKSKPFDSAQADGRNPYATAHIQDEANLHSDITNNTLPQVSFVKFLGPDNEHPGYASLSQGQQHVADLVAAVQANPAIWAHTAIIVTYDEHGGRWDHVTPPSRDKWGPGLRVPAIVISPFAKREVVNHIQYDTSSLLSTLEHRFGLSSLTALDASAPTLTGSFAPCTIPKGTTKQATLSSFAIPSGTSPVVWVHAHLNGISGIPTDTKSTVVISDVSLTLNGTSYAMPGGLVTFDPLASARATTRYNALLNQWETIINPRNIGNEDFFTGAAIPVDAVLASGGAASIQFTTSSNDVTPVSFGWQWGANAFTYFPADWNDALVQAAHGKGLAGAQHAGVPRNSQVQNSIVPGPLGSDLFGELSPTTQSGQCQ